MSGNLVKIHFYKSPWYQVFGWVIRVATNSKINHVSIELPESLGLKETGIYEARASSGVVKSKSHMTTPVYSLNLPFDPNSEKGKKMIEFIEKSVAENISYDFLGVLLGFFGIKIESKKKYFCSEYVDYLYFDLYLGMTNSRLKTNLSPKLIAAKCEAFLWGRLNA